jgi:hypothetical protein
MAPFVTVHDETTMKKLYTSSSFTHSNLTRCVEFGDSLPVSHFPTISPVSPNTFRCVGFKPSRTDGTIRIKSFICSKNVYQNALQRTLQREGPRKWRQSYGSYINTYYSQKLTNISQNNPKINCCMPRIIARKLNQLFVHLIESELNESERAWWSWWKSTDQVSADSELSLAQSLHMRRLAWSGPQKYPPTGFHLAWPCWTLWIQNSLALCLEPGQHLD